MRRWILCGLHSENSLSESPSQSSENQSDRESSSPTHRSPSHDHRSQSVSPDSMISGSSDHSSTCPNSSEYTCPNSSETSNHVYPSSEQPSFTPSVFRQYLFEVLSSQDIISELIRKTWTSPQIQDWLLPFVPYYIPVSPIFPYSIFSPRIAYDYYSHVSVTISEISAFSQYNDTIYDVRSYIHQ